MWPSAGLPHQKRRFPSFWWKRAAKRSFSSHRALSCFIQRSQNIRKNKLKPCDHSKFVANLIVKYSLIKLSRTILFYANLCRHKKDTNLWVSPTTNFGVPFQTNKFFFFLFSYGRPPLEEKPKITSHQA